MRSDSASGKTDKKEVMKVGSNCRSCLRHRCSLREKKSLHGEENVMNEAENGMGQPEIDCFLDYVIGL